MKRILLVAMCVSLVLLGACQVSPVVVTSLATVAPSPTLTAAPTPAATPVPTPTPTPEPTQITVMAVGDLMCLPHQISAAHSGGGYSFDYAFAPVKDILSSADLTIGNLETLIAEGHPYPPIKTDVEPTSTPEESAEVSEEPIEEPDTTESEEPSEDAVGFGPGSVMADIALQHSTTQQRQPLLENMRLNGPESYLDAVVAAGFDVLTTANNHSFDYGADGLKKTIAQLDARGIPHTGTYAEEGDKATPLIVDVQGVKLGILAYTTFVNNGARSPLIGHYDADVAAADIAAAKQAGADFTIVCIHWGKQDTRTVQREVRNTAQHLADSGADLILGSHPHCVQEFDLLETEHGSVPVIYSLGNFVASMPLTINDDGMILKIALEKDNVTGETTLTALSYIPTYCGNTSAGRFAVVPADAASAEGSSTLTKSRNRTIDVLGTEIAKPE